MDVEECSPACNGPPGTHTKSKAAESEDPLRKAVVEWLETQRVTLWGGYFQLTGKDAEFDQAVDWLHSHVKQVLERVEGMGLQHWLTCKDCGVSAPDVEPRGLSVVRCGGCQGKRHAKKAAARTAKERAKPTPNRG